MIDPLGGWAFLWPLALGFVVALLIGSIPFGLLLTRLAGHGDIRKIGSGNIGATNVLRTGSKPLAAATLVLDMVKGAVPVLLGWRYGGPDMAVLGAYGAILGHCFTPWLGFKGGKGVATFLGVTAGLAWPVALCSAVAWIAAAALTRISSVGGLVCVAAAPIASIWLADPQIVEATGAMALLVWARHWRNIRNLLAGKEPRIGRGA